MCNSPNSPHSEFLKAFAGERSSLVIHESMQLHVPRVDSGKYVLGTLVLTLCMAAAMGALHWHVGDELAQDSSALISARQSLQTMRGAHTETSAADFTERLPTAPDVQALVLNLQRSSKALGVVLTAVAVNTTDASPQVLGRSALSVTLQGSYPHLKSVIAESMDRFSNLMLQHLTVQRRASTMDLEARVDLVLLTRPTTDETRVVHP